MRILLLGASGFIGAELARGLVRAGHQVTGLGRDLALGKRLLPQIDWQYGDLRELDDPADWSNLLSGVDVVINASGALQSGLRDDVPLVQYEAMAVLFDAAKVAGIRHIVQISAVGAETMASSDFMSSKALSDAALAASGLSHTILRPGLVIGRNGYGGTELIRIAAAQPIAQIVPKDVGAIQCIALGDVVEAVLGCVADPVRCQGSFDLVEAEARSLAEVVALHRAWLGLGPHRHRIEIPVAAFAPVTWIADALGWLGWRSPLRSNAIAALVNGVTGNRDDLRRLLGRDALSLPETLEFIGGAGKADRWHARIGLLFPLALASLVVLWLTSGVLGLARTGVAAQLLVDGGIDAGLARAGVVAGSLADLAIAVGLLFRPLLALALKSGLLLAAAYLVGSLAISPQMWLDPLGPMLKVIPVLALTAICLGLAEER